MMREVLFAALGMFLTAVINWIFNRRKNKAEVGAAEIENLRTIIAEWEKQAKGWKEQLDEAQEQICQLIRQANDERAAHQDEVIKLSRKIDGMRSEVVRLRKALSAAGINIDEKIN